MIVLDEREGKDEIWGISIIFKNIGGWINEFYKG